MNKNETGFSRVGRKHIFHVLIFLILMFLAIFVWLQGLNIISSYTDLSYHLATAQGFVKAGGIVTWDFWESLPLGRPHNYPPAFHLVLASLLKSGLNPSAAAKLMMELVVVGGMAFYAWGINKLFGVRIAFWSALFLALSLHFTQLSVTVMPASLVVFLAPALFYFVIKRRWLSFAALQIICFYLHLFIPFLVLFSIFVYLIAMKRKLLLPFIAASLFAFCLYLPWLLHIVTGGWEYIKYLDAGSVVTMWHDYVTINLILLLLAVLGLTFIIRRRTSLAESYYFFLIGLTVFLLPSFLMASRMIDGHLLPFASVLSAFMICELLKTKLKFILTPLILFYCLFTPTLLVGEHATLCLKDSTIITVFFHRSGEITTGDPAIRFDNVIKAIKARSKTGDTITADVTSFDGAPVDKNYSLSISNIFASYTNLATLNLRSPEINHRSSPDITKTRFLLTNDFKQYASSATDNFELIATIPPKDEMGTYVNLYYNPQGNAIKEHVIKADLPLWAGDMDLAMLICMICYDQNHNKIINPKEDM